MSDRLGQKARIRGGATGFIGLDVDVTSSGQVISGPTAIAYDRIRKDTGAFVWGGGTLAGVLIPAGNGVLVPDTHEGDWEVDCMVNFSTDHSGGSTVPVGVGINLVLNDFSVQFTGDNWTHVFQAGAGDPGNSLMIAGFTFYGLVAGDVIWSLMGGDCEIQSNTFCRYRYLGSAS